MFRKLKNKFREPINSIELKKVIQNGLLFAVIFAAIFGIVGYFSLFIPNFSFLTSFSLIIAYLLSNRIRSKHYNGHILYKIIAVFCWLLAYYLMYVVIYNIDFFITDSLPNYVRLFYHYGDIYNPANVFGFLYYPLFNFTNPLVIFNYILNLLFFILGIVITYRNSSRY